MSTLPLYGEYFGLTSQPFSVSPDPKFLYGSPSHKEGLAQLAYGIQARRGFVVLTGEVGTGKTTLIRSLLQQMSDGHTRIAFIFTLITNIRDLLRTVCEDFGLTSPKDAPKDMHDYLALLNEFLLDSYKKNEGVALVIDEAQNLSREVLEGVRLLSNFETAEDKLLQILLIGQPELDARLNEPELRQLKQRVALRWHLSPLSPFECAEYISRRLEIAGGVSALFPTETVRAIHAYSGGIPRLINILCDNGLLTAYALNERHVTVAMIEEAARDLNLSAEPRKRVPATTATIPIPFPESLAAKAEPENPAPAGVAAVPPPPAIEENAAVLAGSPSIQLPEAPAAKAEPQSPLGEAIASAPRVEEDAAAPAASEPPPVPEIQSAAKAALEAAQQRAAEIQQGQATPTEARERTFPKPALAPKTAVLKAAAQPERPPAAVAREADAASIETDVKKPELKIVNGAKAEIRMHGVEAGGFAVETVPPQSIHRMVAALTEAMGPMASLVVRDHADAMGESTERFPKRRFHELVYSTSGEILSERLKARYESLMSEEVRALGAFEE